MVNSSERGISILRELNETNIPQNMLGVWYLGQASMLIKGSGDKIIAIDPYLDPAPYRAFPPPFAAEALTNLGCVCITHDHIDHLDPHAIKAIAAANKETIFIAPSYCHPTLQECGVDPENIRLADTNNYVEYMDIKIKAVPAAHEAFEYDEESGHRFVGYLLDLNGVKVYHAGDTIVYPDLVENLKVEQIDLAFLPINGRDIFRNEGNIVGNMNVREAAELAVRSEIDTVIPIHYDMFEGNQEWPGRFTDYLYEHYPYQKHHVLARFERFIFVPSTF